MTLRYSNGSISYSITIAPGALAQAGELFALQRKVLVVTDKGVPARYADAVLRQCPYGYLLTLEGGEGHKNLDSVQAILTSLLEHGFTRGDALVAVGGGVVGDMVGFAASCYMRGIDWYNVPTTLLSQVDSSVGGKTGVNFLGIKNIVGAFHHPSGVLIDTGTLDTLSPRLFAEGLAEVIKMAATSDAELFRLLERTDDLRPIMDRIIASALSIKIAVVESDPTEQGLRAVLNFGHTIGHALEGASNRLSTTIPRSSAAAPRGTGGVPPETPCHGHALEGASNRLSTTIPRSSAAAPRGTGGVPPETPCVGTSCLQNALSQLEKGAAGKTNAGVASVDRGRPWPCEWGGPAPVGAGGMSEAKSFGGNSSEVKPAAAFYHGEAVAVGMMYTSSGEARERIEKVLKKFGLPTDDPFSTEQLLEFALYDKKKRGGKIKIVKVNQIGSFRFEEAGPESLIDIIQARKK